MPPSRTKLLPSGPQAPRQRPRPPPAPLPPSPPRPKPRDARNPLPACRTSPLPCRIQALPLPKKPAAPPNQCLQRSRARRADENSPALQRWESSHKKRKKSRQGRKRRCARFCRPLRDFASPPRPFPALKRRAIPKDSPMHPARKRFAPPPRPCYASPMPAQPPFTASAWFPRAGNRQSGRCLHLYRIESKWLQQIPAS